MSAILAYVLSLYPSSSVSIFSSTSRDFSVQGQADPLEQVHAFAFYFLFEPRAPESAKFITYKNRVDKNRGFEFPVRPIAVDNLLVLSGTLEWTPTRVVLRFIFLLSARHRVFAQTRCFDKAVP